MSEHLDGEALPIEPAASTVGSGAKPRKPWHTPRLTDESIEGVTHTGINPTNVETDPPFNNPS